MDIPREWDPLQVLKNHLPAKHVCFKVTKHYVRPRGDLTKKCHNALYTYTVRTKSLNECGYFPSNRFQWKTHIEMTLYMLNCCEKSTCCALTVDQAFNSMQIFHWNPFDGKYPHSFNDLFLGVYPSNCLVFQYNASYLSMTQGLSNAIHRA